MQTLQVGLGERAYPIRIGHGLDPALLLPHVAGRQVLLVSNTTVAPLYLRDYQYALQAADLEVASCVLPDGEQYKTLQTLNQIYDALLSQRFNRDCTLIALGGGVVGDMTGYAAATYQRGVAFIQIPTTLLAQVDSSVGGKTGVNHPLGKNMIGAFKQPRVVLADLQHLDTLPDRELSAGLAEIIKYALIADLEFLGWLEQHMAALRQRDPHALREAVYRSCAHKARIVAADEFEQGERALLNLGHTFGHAIETAMGYGSWLHGEAVGVGMMMAADLSQRLGWLSEAEVKRVEGVVAAAGLPIQAPELEVEQFIALMMQDKKVLAGNLRLVLLRGLGQGVVSREASREQLVATLQKFLGGQP